MDLKKVGVFVVTWIGTMLLTVFLLKTLGGPLRAGLGF